VDSIKEWMAFDPGTGIRTFRACRLHRHSKRDKQGDKDDIGDIPAADASAARPSRPRSGERRDLVFRLRRQHE
jgi:hypothetical protein